MIIDAVVGFFILGIIARVIKSDIEFPKPLYDTLTLFLLVAIGLKGGIALSAHADSGLLYQSLAVIAFGFVLPLLAFPVLSFFGKLDRADAASIAAHYGSVSVGTYAVAVAVLDSQQIQYEAYMPLFVVLLEIPAIIIGAILLSNQLKGQSIKPMIHEVICNPSIILMVGALIIGYSSGDTVNNILPFFGDMFYGVLALFLMQMGLIAGSKIKDIQAQSSFIVAFGIAMPLVSAVLGTLLGVAIGLTEGGTILLAVLGASASYIAVPAAMQMIAPNANHGLSITSSLGVTFPFNVIVGIPIYIALAHYIYQ